MDWIRRNWPDLLIGFALLAVISGIVATLLTGGSFFPGQNQSAQTQDTRPPAQESLNQPARTDPADQGTDEIPAGAPGSVREQDSLADDGPVDPFAEAAAEQAAAEDALADTIDPLELPSVVALRPGADPDAAQQAPAAQQPAAAPAQQTQQEQQQAATQQPAQTQEPAAAPAASSGQLPSSTVPYTVGVGAFRNQDNAQRQADVFRQAGYPVVVASQDDFTVVLLGPYSTRTEAERTGGAVTAGGFGVTPIVYTYQDDEADGQTGTSAAEPAPAAQQEPASAAQPAATPAATPDPQPVTTEPEPAATATAAGRYLQVGAYSSTDNATAQAGQLEELGYAVTQQQDGNLIRVLVGPFAEGQLSGARDRLAAQGIDSVPR